MWRCCISEPGMIHHMTSCNGIYNGNNMCLKCYLFDQLDNKIFKSHSNSWEYKRFHISEILDLTEITATNRSKRRKYLIPKILNFGVIPSYNVVNLQYFFYKRHFTNTFEIILIICLYSLFVICNRRFLQTSPYNYSNLWPLIKGNSENNVQF